MPHFDNTSERLLENEYDCTTRLSSGGGSVAFGDADSAGARVDDWDPPHYILHSGVVFARSH